MGVADAAVVGAGGVGLACAVSLARRGLKVMVLESAGAVGTETSSRNSEVIHAGIYYPEGSLKARLCVEGRERLYAFCHDRGVPHRKIGKIIFAADEAQRPALKEIADRGLAAGVNDLCLLSRGDLRSLEPELGCAAALLSPSTGIIDSHALMLALEGELEARGGRVVCNTRVSEVRQAAGGWAIDIDGSDGPALTVPLLVNSAGLRATAIAERIEDLDSRYVPVPAFARGCYFSYARTVPFRHLIYPVPVPGGLGTHLTLDLAGRARFGPNVEWIERLDYSVDCSLHAEFLAAARKIWPGIDPDALFPDYAGIRPKVRTAAGIATDFIISGPADHGKAGLVNLFGIESPGLTACLAIGDEVAERIYQAPA